MDRWDDDEDYKHPKQLGRVARLGMGGFVKSEDAGTSGAGQPDKQVTIEIVQSKKEQKQQAIAASQPKLSSEPPRPAASLPPPPLRLPNLPDWVGGSVPSGAHLKVLKEGQCVQRIELCKAATIFGRNPAADVPLEHASISRTHAALCSRSSSGIGGSSKLYLLDFGSVHGTFLNNIRVGKGCPVEVTPGAVMRFGASTRHFVLDIQARAPSSRRPLPQEGGAAEEGVDGAMDPPPRKKGRVRFGDEVDVGGLEEVLGYSDGSSFQPLVGPKPVATGGQFAALTTSTATPPPPPRPSEPRGDGSSSAAVEGGSGTGGGASGGAAGGGGSGGRVKPQLQEFITSLRAKPRGLYEELQ